MVPTKRNAPGAQSIRISTNNYQRSYYSKKFPPYGRRLDEIRRKGRIPLLRVICTTDWNLGAAYPRIVIPEATKPEQLQFGYLSGLSVQIVHHNNEVELVEGLIDEILKVKPKSLALFNFDIAQQQDSKNRAFSLIYPALEVLANDL